MSIRQRGGVEAVSVWTAGGRLKADIGVIALGDAVLPLFEIGTEIPSLRRIQATTYRAGQQDGWVRVVLSCPDLIGGAVLVGEQRLKLTGGRAGEDRLTICFQIHPDGSLQLSVLDGGEEQNRCEPISFVLPDEFSPSSSVALADFAREPGQRAIVAAELFMRWLRGLLREPASRRAVRGRFDEFVTLCDQVEACIDAEDAGALARALAPVQAEARDLSATLGVALFPVDAGVLFLPEN